MAKKKNLNTAPATPYTRKEKYLSVMAGVTDLDTLPTNPQNREERYLDAIANKPGGGSYTAGDGIKIDENNEISVDTETIQPKLTAGTNITIDADNVISANGGGGSLYWHFLIYSPSSLTNAKISMIIINQSPNNITYDDLKTILLADGVINTMGLVNKNNVSSTPIYMVKSTNNPNTHFTLWTCKLSDGLPVLHEIEYEYMNIFKQATHQFL